MKTNNQSFMQKVKEWIKAHKVASTFIAIAVIIAAFAIDNAEQEQQEKENKQATEQSEKQHEKEDKAKDDKASDVEVDNEEVANTENDVEEVETDVEESKQDELSDEFRTNASNYLDQVAISYMTLGDLQTATTESEMMGIIKDGQAEYNKSNQYYTQIDPQNEKEQELFEKISKIDGLTSRALMNVEAGLNDYDTELIDLATEDIEKAGQIATEIETEVE